MRRAAPALLSLIALAVPASAQAPPPTVDPRCKPSAAGCRYVDSIRLRLPNGATRDIPVRSTLPFITGEAVRLYPGESVVVTLKRLPGRFRAATPRAGAKPGPGEVALSFALKPNGGAVITVFSRWAKPLDYAAAINGPTTRGLARLPVCTARPGVATPHASDMPVGEVLLAGFVETDTPGCKTITVPGDAAAQAQARPVPPARP